MTTQGVIRANEAYTMKDVMARLSWTASAFRSACRSGLTICKVGKRQFVLGSDLMAFLESKRVTSSAETD